MPTKVTEHFFEYNSVKYFRDKAENLVLGSYGEKKDALGPAAQLDEQGRVKAEYLKGRVQTVPPVAIDWAGLSGADAALSGSVKFFGLTAAAGGSLTLEKARSAKLKLVKLFISGGPLTRLLNQDANIARTWMADEGGDARIVSEVWIAVDAQLSEQFSTAASVSADAAAELAGMGKAIALTLGGGKHGTVSVTLGSGSTFAYLMHKVKDWNKGKTQIEELEIDEKGMS